MSRIPGTFKDEPILLRDLSPTGLAAERMLIDAGALYAMRYLVGHPPDDCTAMLGREPLGPGGEMRWHLSVSHPVRYPTWDEIKTAVYGIASLRKVTMGQVLGPVGPGEWVNIAENCFHLYEIKDPAWTT